MRPSTLVVATISREFVYDERADWKVPERPSSAFQRKISPSWNKRVSSVHQTYDLETRQHPMSVVGSFRRAGGRRRDRGPLTGGTSESWFAPTLLKTNIANRGGGMHRPSTFQRFKLESIKLLVGCHT